MSDHSNRLDALIDEALQDLTAGEPRDGLRGRVLARIAAEPGSSRGAVIDVFGWRVRPIQLAAASAIGALIFVAALAVPLLLRTGGAGLPETRTAANPPATAVQPAANPARQPAATVLTQAVNTSAQPQSGRPAVQRAAETTEARAAVEESSLIARLTIPPLSDPAPIVNGAIDIKPVQIEELAIPDIQVRPLDAGPAKRDNK